jgi:hypothetical protein
MSARRPVFSYFSLSVIKHARTRKATVGFPFGPSRRFLFSALTDYNEVGQKPEGGVPDIHPENI